MKNLMITSLVALTLAVPAIAQAGPMDPGMNFETLDADKDGNLTQAEVDTARAARFAAADTNSDGKLDAAEMLAQATAMQAEHMAQMLEQMKSAAPKRIAHMMIELDANSDGFLTVDEFETGRADKMFAHLDADGDGVISSDEAATMRRQMHDRMGGGDRGRGHGWFGNWGFGRH